MTSAKIKILNNICYTELVYGRINKKLNSKYSQDEIERLLYEIISKSNEKDFNRKGKNYYISNSESNIRITINSNTLRVITVDVLSSFSK